MSKTPVYGLITLDPFTKTSTIINADAQRFQTIEAQLLAYYTLFGNGVIDDNPLSPSWQLQGYVSNGQPGVIISPGHGFVSFMSAITTVNSAVSLVAAGVAIGQSPTLFYIYATKNATTPDKQTVDFIASLVQLNDPNNYIGLGSVGVSVDAQGNVNVVAYNDSVHGRNNISLFASLASIINKHKHIGGATNPSQISLDHHVQGKLSGSYIQNLDLSTVTSGVLNSSLLPQISHDSLSHIGILNHPEIDSLINVILSKNASNGSRLWNYATVNELVGALGLKKQSTINGLSASQANSLKHSDQNLFNSILYIPGVSPDSFATPESTLTAANIVPAQIDNTNHQIVGTVGNTVGTDMIVWTTSNDFQNAISSAPVPANPNNLLSDPAYTHDVVVINGTDLSSDGAITTDKPTYYKKVADSNLTNWASGYVFVDNSIEKSIAPPANTPLNHFVDDYSVSRYFYYPFGLSPLGTPQDWTLQQQIGICFGLGNNTNTGSISNPGKIYMYLLFSQGGTSTSINLKSGGTANINISTPVVVYDPTVDNPGAPIYKLHNLTEFGTKTNLGAVTGIGFYWQTSTGWDRKDVDFYLSYPNDQQVGDYVSSARVAALDSTSNIFIYNSTNFSPQSALVFRFNSNNQSTQFDQVNWDVNLLTGTQFQVSTRVASTSSNLSSAPIYQVPVTSYTSIGGQGITAHMINTLGSKGQWIDIIVNLTSSSSLSSAPVLNKITLSYNSSGLPARKDWNTSEKWLQGIKIENLTLQNYGNGNSQLILTNQNKVGRFIYARSGNIFESFSSSGADENLLYDGSNLYQTPLQVWNSSTGGNTQGFSNINDTLLLKNGNVIIADTGNDRVVEIDSFGNLVRAIQGNLSLRMISRDFVALTCNYNPRIGKMWITFSQNVTVSNLANLTVVNFGGTDSISFSNTGVNSIIFNPIGGFSPTIQVTFSATLQAKMNSWVGQKTVVIGSGAVSVSATASSSGGTGTTGTTGTNSNTGSNYPGGYPGSSGSTGGSSGTGTGSYYTGTTGSSTNGTTANASSPNPPSYVNGLYNVLGTLNLTGTLQSYPGLPVPATNANANTGDFNADGKITTGLQGTGGQINSINLAVAEGEIIFDNVYQPLSVQVTPKLNSLIVGSIGANTATSYDTLGNILWSVPTTLVPMISGLGGSVYYNESAGTAVFAAPDTTGSGFGQVIVLNIQGGNVPLSVISVSGNAVKAIPKPNSQEYWVALDDVINNGAQSRLVRIDSSGKVLFNWGNSILTHPTGLKILDNGDLLISE